MSPIRTIAYMLTQSWAGDGVTTNVETHEDMDAALAAAARLALAHRPPRLESGSDIVKTHHGYTVDGWSFQVEAVPYLREPTKPEAFDAIAGILRRDPARPRDVVETVKEANAKASALHYLRTQLVVAAHGRTTVDSAAIDAAMNASEAHYAELCK